MLWLGFLGKLQTNDLTKAYSGRVIQCQLCNRHPETFSHLFFLCEYSSIIIQTALNLGDWNHLPLNWTGLTEFICSFQGRKLSKQILCLTLAVSYYKLWEGRNKKLHNDSAIPPNRLANDVVNIIKSRLSTCHSFIKATNFCQYYCNWLMFCVYSL